MKVMVEWLSVYAMPARDKSIEVIQVCVCARFFYFVEVLKLFVSGRIYVRSV